MAESLANNAATALDGGINNLTTSIDVDDASSFPSSGQFRVRIDDELLLVTAVTGNTLTVVRGVESTAAASHDDDSAVSHILTARSVELTNGQYGDPGSVLNASSGSITITGSYHRVEGGDFQNIFGGVIGQRLLLQYSGSGAIPTILHGYGNIRLKDGVFGVSMSINSGSIHNMFEFIFDGTNWQYLSGSVNEAGI